MSKIIGLIVSNLYVGTPDQTKQIDQKYIFPDAYDQSGLSYDGNKWITSPGYGMYVKGEECEIEWDGDPTGKETASVFCKVSDLQLSSPYSLIGGELIKVIDGEEREYTIETVANLGDDVVAYKGIYFINGQDIIYSTVTASIVGITLTPGFWFSGTSTSNYVKSLVKDDDDVVVPFWRDYIPLKMNPDETVTYGKLSKLKFGSAVYQVGDDLTFNPGMVISPTPLTAIKTGNTYYSIPEVTANPTETASQTLSKIKIGNTSYNISNGEERKYLKQFKILKTTRNDSFYTIYGKYYSNSNTVENTFSFLCQDLLNNNSVTFDLQGKYAESPSSQEININSDISYLRSFGEYILFYGEKKSIEEGGDVQFSTSDLFTLDDSDTKTVTISVIG